MSSRPARSLASTFGGHSPNGGPSLVAVPPIMLRPPEAAAALGMSLDTFNRLVRPHVRAYRSHKLKLYPTAELERWRSRTRRRCSEATSDTGLPNPSGS